MLIKKLAEEETLKTNFINFEGMSAPVAFNLIDRIALITSATIT